MAYDFEKNIITPILDIIKNEQDYLCKKENLPQLAKLGYIYNTLFYGGRMCYGYDGKIEKGESCEDNPKYVIEEIGNTDEQEDYIYDAWGMHVTNGIYTKPYDEFKNLIINGKDLSDFDIKKNKPHKTFDEWVDVLTNSGYEYMYDDRREVANHLLCTNGNGYDISKSGYVINSSSGSDLDDFSNWENAKFRDVILYKITQLLEIPELKLVIDKTQEVRLEYIREEEAKEQLTYASFKPDGFVGEFKKADYKKEIDRLMASFEKGTEEEEEEEEEEEVYQYYPLCQYALLCNFDKNTHISYIKEGMNICQEIITNKESYLKDDKHGNNKETVRRANKYIKKWSYVLREEKIKKLME